MPHILFILFHINHLLFFIFCCNNMWVFFIGTSRSCTVNTFMFSLVVFVGPFEVVVLDLFLDPVDLTSVRGLNSNFYFVLFFKTTGLVLIFVGVVSSTFIKMLFMLKVGVTRKISEPNISYSNIYKTVPLAIISPTVLENFSFKVKNTNPKRL